MTGGEPWEELLGLSTHNPSTEAEAGGLLSQASWTTYI